MNRVILAATTVIITGAVGCTQTGGDSTASSSSSGSAACTASAQCNGRVCIAGSCSDCQGNAECAVEYGAGSRCVAGSCTPVGGPDGGGSGSSTSSGSSSGASSSSSASSASGTSSSTGSSSSSSGAPDGGGGDAGCTRGTDGCACTNTGACNPGLLCRTGVGCSPPRPCSALNCGANRLCQESTSTADAVCLDQCEQGFNWVSSSQTCEPQGACSGSTGTTCAAQNRTCVESSGTASCGSCLSGFVPDLGVCRARLTCSGITCPGTCTEGGANSDASCDPVSSCGTNQAQTPGTSGTCVTCTVSCPDDVPNGTIGGHWAVTDGADRCVCKTAPGWFWDTSNNVAKMCDADGDGWINASAATFMGYSLSVPTEEAAARSWRCAPQVVDSITLRTVFGEQHVSTLPSAITLVETNRNDDQAELDQANEPLYGGRRLRAAELNSLTRACISTLGDANDNNVQDHLESHGTMSGANTAEQAFADHSYFLELHTGRYVPPAGSGNGTFMVTEKPRGGGAGEAAPVYPQSGYWESCGTRPDSAFRAGEPAQGMDFARFTPTTGFGGMNHHSQFKCVLVVNTLPINSPPNQMTPAQFTSAGLIANSCTVGASAASLPPAEAPNPFDAPVTCTPSGATPSNGMLLWAAVPFNTYASSGQYIRGCVDECRETDTTCPHCPSTSSDCNAGDVCQSATSDFGRRTGCACPFGTYASNGVCTAHMCGDGVEYDEDYGITSSTSGYEQCDLGTGTNSNAPDALCRTDCTDKRCGDGIRDTGEGCDTGTFSSAANQCHAGCVAPRCGDATVDNASPYNEQCDLGDGNNSESPNAACRTNCLNRRCGDGVQDSGESCDLGSSNSSQPNASCRPDCTARRCGDGVVDSGEACDNGTNNSNNNGSTCRVDCSGPSCSNGEYRNGTTCATCAPGTTSTGGTVTTCTTVDTCSNIMCSSGSRVFLNNSQAIQHVCASNSCGTATSSICQYSTNSFYVMCPTTSAPSDCSTTTIGPYNVITACP